MAGPTAAVLFGSKLTDAHRAALRTRLDCGAPSGQYDDFRLEERPFILNLGPRSPQELFVDETNDLRQVFGWTPEDEVSFAAMCNDREDHRLLARLCVELAEEAGGVIDFQGALSIGPRLDGSNPARPVRASNPEGLDGVLWATAYRTVWGSLATAHYGDVAFVREWLADPRFHMVK
jgi:Family of unknown function (DUF6368)